MSRPPSRSSSRVGLPSNPSPRSRSGSFVSEQPQPRRAMVVRHRSTASEHLPLISFTPPLPPPRLPDHSLRHYRSAGSLPANPMRSRSLDRKSTPRAYSPPPPLPIPKVGLLAAKRSEGNNDDITSAVSSAIRKRSDASVSSWSSLSSGSSASSRQGLSPGYASSVTSVEESLPDSRKNGSYSEAQSPPVTSRSSTSPSSIGSALRERVATVKDALTVNVSKAWAANLSPDAGEATPIGQESRLTRAMKAYHINKAHSPADLPEWLFEDRDRGIIGGLKVTNPDLRVDTSAADYQRSSRGVSTFTSEREDESALRESVRLTVDASVNRRPTHSRGTLNRLKELRMSKRHARVRFADDEDEVIPATTVEVTPASTFPRAPRPAVPKSAAPSYDPAPWIGMVPPRKAPTPPASIVRGRQGRARIGLPSAVKLKA